MEALSTAWLNYNKRGLHAGYATRLNHAEAFPSYYYLLHIAWNAQIY
jgi:hypothetical protein